MKLFYNGKIWQWNSAPAQWMVIKDNKILELGYDDPPQSWRDQCELIDFEGQLVLPGLYDSHIHLYHMGEITEYIQLHDCISVEMLRDRVLQYEKQYPQKQWILGFGWDQEKLGKYPTKEDFQGITKPILLWRACWHIAVTNIPGMKLAGIDPSNTEWTISGGSIDIDAHGLTGVFREGATELIQKYITEESDMIRKRYIEVALQQCLQAGLVAVQTNDHDAWHIYQELQQENKMPIRVFLTSDCDEIGQNPRIPKAGACEGLLSCHRVKLFADGSFGAETAALRTNYRGTTNKGILTLSDDKMTQMISTAQTNGYRIEVHAIGDRAAEQVINIVKQLQISPEQRPILTHCQILGPDLIERMGNMGIIANIQPSFVITDAPIAEQRLEDSVKPFTYCWKKLMDSGIVCAGGSDAPIETCNPLQGMYDAIFRSKDSSTSGYLPNEVLSFEEALKLYTLNGAYTAGVETTHGDLKVGNIADFVVVDRNVATRPELLNQAKVCQVYINGSLVQPNKAMVESLQAKGNHIPGKNGRLRLCRCCRQRN